ncbi:MAG: GDP-mannose 4,6-dehydratase [bacterium]
MTEQKTALITGFTGQDGSYLALYLLKLGYQVVGLTRRISTEPPPRFRLPELLNYYQTGQLKLAVGEMADYFSITQVLRQYQPDEIYNLAAQSHVGISFQTPEETIRVNFIGALNVVRAAQDLKLPTKIYQASTSEMFGNAARETEPQNENTPFRPISPYGIAKLAAHNIMAMARNTEQGFAIPTTCGILFNHESPIRGENFVTRKITKAVARMARGEQEILELGSLSSERDWGFAGDYVKMMHLMLQQPGLPHEWQDFVVATGVKHTVREFVEAAFRAIGWQITWQGEGANEQGLVNGQLRVRVSPEFYRPNEIWTLRGNPAKARQLLGWEPTTAFDDLVKMMVKADLESISEESASVS